MYDPHHQGIHRALIFPSRFRVGDQYLKQLNSGATGISFELSDEYLQGFIGGFFGL